MSRWEWAKVTAVYTTSALRSLLVDFTIIGSNLISQLWFFLVVSFIFYLFFFYHFAIYTCKCSTHTRFIFLYYWTTAYRENRVCNYGKREILLTFYKCICHLSTIMLFLNKVSKLKWSYKLIFLSWCHIKFFFFVNESILHCLFMNFSYDLFFNWKVTFFF